MAEAPPGLAAVRSALVCPHCRGGLDLDPPGPPARLVCGAGHAFDVARQGYVSLLSGGGAAVRADSTEMIDARSRFLGAGWYRRFVDAVAGVVAESATGAGGVIVDCGAGEGTYLRAAVTGCGGRGIGVDLSKPAARRLARSGPRIGAVVADGWDRLPIADGAAGAVLNVFAPRNPAEFARMLAPGGVVVVLSAAADHLRELVGPLGMIGVQEGKVARLDAALGSHFELLAREDHRWTMALPAGAVADLVGMGPSARHRAAQRPAALADLTARGPVEVTAAGLLSVFRLRGPGG